MTCFESVKVAAIVCLTLLASCQKSDSSDPDSARAPTDQGGSSTPAAPDAGRGPDAAAAPDAARGLDAAAAPDAARRPEAPAAPRMPDGWVVVEDVTFGRADIAPVAERLGGEIAALRNTTYAVGGNRVKLNTIVAADAASADAVAATLLKMKPAWAMLRRGEVIYEFVGPNAAIPAMQAARAYLDKTLP